VPKLTPARRLYAGEGIERPDPSAQLCDTAHPLSSVLLKNGVRDAWSGAPESRSKIQATLAHGVMETSMAPVSQAYLDRTVRHHLELGLAAGRLPPAGLLQVAETIGAAPWQPELVEWRNVLDAMLGELPAAMLEQGVASAVLRTSGTWGNINSIAESWFEDDQEAARLLSGVHRRQRAKMADYVLQSVIVRRREKWAEHFVWTALWLREAPDDDALPWLKFAILARALSDGHDVSEIPLMRDIAARTVMAIAPSLT
jgi:hypothetical protein